MLSNVGRAAIRRVGAGAQSTNGALLRISCVDINHKASRTQNQSLLSNCRSHATAADGKTTTKRTRSAKLSATKTTKPAAKRPVATSAKKSITNLGTKSTKKPTSAPKKKVASKARPKRKGLTDLQKEKLAAQKERAVAKKQQAALKLSVAKEKKKAQDALRKERDLATKPARELRELKAAALSPPEQKTRNSYNVYTHQVLAGKPFAAGTGVSEAAAKYKTLSAEEKETLSRTVEQNIADNKIALATWIESHTPDQILQANKARAALRRLTKQRGRWAKIDDPRIPTTPLSGWNVFTKEQVHELKGGDMPPQQVLRAVADKWKSLSETERKPYIDAAENDKFRYLQEYKTVFQRDSPIVAKTA